MNNVDLVKKIEKARELYGDDAVIQATLEALDSNQVQEIIDVIETDYEVDLSKDV